MFKEGEQVGDSTWGDQGCDGGGHGQRGPKEVPNPGGARLAGNEGKFPCRRDWSLTEQVKWGRKGEGHPRQKEQQEQRHRAGFAGPALAGISRRGKWTGERKVLKNWVLINPGDMRRLEEVSMPTVYSSPSQGSKPCQSGEVRMGSKGFAFRGGKGSGNKGGGGVASTPLS